LTTDPTVQLIEQLRDRALRRGGATAGADRERAELWGHIGAAVQNSRVDELPEPRGRLVALKRLVLSLGRFSWSRQRAANQAFSGALAELVREIDRLAADVEQEGRTHRVALAALEARLSGPGSPAAVVAAEVTLLRGEVERLRLAVENAHTKSVLSDEAIATLSIDLSSLSALLAETGEADEVRQQTIERTEIRVQNLELAKLTSERRLIGLARDIGRLTAGASVPGETVDELVGASERDTHQLYERFEDEFRPGGELLTEAFSQYIPDVEHLSGGTHRLVDIGCGRGDWLKVLRTHGIPALGIDTNSDAVERAVADGLEAIVADGIEYLREVDAESVGAISAFHVVEHLPPETVIDLVDAALHALAPGGVLVLETPNPSNVTVGSSAFWRDPTHLRPIESSYLAFLVQDRGFVSVETRFLHPTPQYELELKVLSSDERPAIGRLLNDMSWALHGPQDYAIVARRPPIAP
jgi:SAM-dependent methyltransferase